jgi:transcriptional regulator with XRE-family HTH domain
MPIEKEIRNALDAAMHAGRTSADIGQAAGINAVTVRQFRAGKRSGRSLSVANLEKLAVALGLQIKVHKGNKGK